MLSKATEFGRRLNELEYKNDIDVNWINRWKKQYVISNRKLFGESSYVCKEVVTDWKNSILNELLLRYELENTLNCDKCGLFCVLLLTEHWLSKKKV